MKRQSIRETYKQLVNDAKKYVEDNDMDGIVNICGEMKKIYNEVKHTREAILDITLMNHLANFSYKKIQTIETNFIFFDPKVFIQKLLNSDPESLRSSFCKVAYAPTTPFVYVNESINNDTNEQPIRKRRSVHIDPNALTHKLVKVSKVSGNEIESNINNENNFSKNIIRIYDMIESYIKEGHIPVHLSDVLASAKDFSQAVDFNFCIAFLVRDGRLKMEAKSNELSGITLEPLNDEDNTNKSDSTNSNKESSNDSNKENNNNKIAPKKSQYQHQQLVLPLCYDTWKKYVTAINEKKS